MHWNNDASVGQLLDIFERVNKETPIGNLRWSIAHLNDASEASLRRMQALGVGWTVQDAMYFGGDGYVQQAGAAAAKRVPPVETGRKIGVAIGYNEALSHLLQGGAEAIFDASKLLEEDIGEAVAEDVGDDALGQPEVGGDVELPLLVLKAIGSAGV